MCVLEKITPVPQQAERKSGNGAMLGKIGEPDFKIVVKNAAGALAGHAVELLKKNLSGALASCAETANGSVVIELSVCDKAPANIKNAEQAYSLDVSEKKITVTGYGDAGLYYGVTTLCQCLVSDKNCVTIPAISVTDWPDLKTRGHFMECRYGSNLMTEDDWEALVDDMADMKLNQLVVGIYGCWCVQYDGVISEYLYIPIPKYPKLEAKVITRYYSPKTGKWIHDEKLPPMVTEDFLGNLIAYGKTRGVEVLPLFNSYGHNTLIPRMYPEVSAVLDGKKSGHSFCTECDETYDMLFSIYDYIIDKYLKPNGIESFHIGMDEVRDEIATNTDDVFRVTSPWCTCEKCSKLTDVEKFLTHAVRLIAHLKARGMKNVYIYSDIIVRKIGANAFNKIIRDNHLEDVTVVDWWTYCNFKEGLMFPTTSPELGLRATLKPWNAYYHWNVVANAVANVRILAEMAKKENSEGMQCYSAWDKSFDRNHVSVADYSWNLDGTGNEVEFYNRYTARNFGTRFEEAKRAFEFMDIIVRTENNYNDDGSLKEEKDMPLANRALMESKLAYYFYSYVRQGKPYPRNFPGEAVEFVLSRREDAERALNEISAMSREALAIFESIAKDASCNVKLAERFAYECNNYMCIADDYLALLKIYDIMNKEERNACVSSRVAAIAKERKCARLACMLRLETVKEAFLVPSHMRNQSIFMQLFADIEAYAEATDPAELSLDVCNLSNIGSKNFFALR